MPIYLRNFYLRELIAQKEEESKEIEKANSRNPRNPSKLNR